MLAFYWLLQVLTSQSKSNCFASCISWPWRRHKKGLQICFLEARKEFNTCLVEKSNISSYVFIGCLVAFDKSKNLFSSINWPNNWERNKGVMGGKSLQFKLGKISLKSQIYHATFLYQALFSLACLIFIG